ncbi:MAG: aldose 1-epimerase [Vulcanisaeta sp.]
MHFIEIKKRESKVIVSSKGAYIIRWSIAGKDILLPGNLEKPTRGGMAIMIPYANRVKNGEYEFEGIRYTLPKNEEGHAIHGLILNETWSIESMGEGNVILKHVLKHPGYPTELTSIVNYILNERELKVIMRIRNTGSRSAPLVIGAHPYFLATDDWRVRVDGDAYICEAVNKIPTGRLLPFNLDSTNRRDFDDCFLINGKIILESKYSTIEIERQNMPYIQIYTGIPNAIAIEPMSGAPDAYHNGMGLIKIQSNEERTFTFTIRVLRI